MPNPLSARELAARSADDSVAAFAAQEGPARGRRGNPLRARFPVGYTAAMDSELEVAIRDFLGSGDGSSARARLLEALDTVGWARLEHPMTQGEFERCAELLGTITTRSRVFLNPSPKARSYQRPGPLGFHSDGGDPDYLAWFCERPSQSGAETLLLPVERAVATLCAEHREILQRTLLPPIAQDRGEALPILRVDRFGYRLSFAPWRVQDLYSTYAAPQREAVDALLDALLATASDEVIGIDWRANECLFIRNGHLLHGRGPLDPTSDRLLHRLWIDAHPRPE